MRTLAVVIHICDTKEELAQAAKEAGSNPWYGLKYLRGFRLGNHYWVLDNCMGFLAVNAHELGHILGYKHTYWPGIMNFSGLFRWFAFDLTELKRLWTKLKCWIESRKS